MVRDPDGNPLIEVTFIKDEIFELDEAGRHRGRHDRILMSIRNRSGRRMEIDGQQGPSDQTFHGFVKVSGKNTYF